MVSWPSVSIIRIYNHFHSNIQIWLLLLHTPTLMMKIFNCQDTEIALCLILLFASCSELSFAKKQGYAWDWWVFWSGINFKTMFSVLLNVLIKPMLQHGLQVPNLYFRCVKHARSFYSKSLDYLNNIIFVNILDSVYLCKLIKGVGRKVYQIDSLVPKSVRFDPLPTCPCCYLYNLLL